MNFKLLFDLFNSGFNAQLQQDLFVEILISSFEYANQGQLIYYYCIEKLVNNNLTIPIQYPKRTVFLIILKNKDYELK